MIGVRKSLDFIFTQYELKVLDDLMPESHKEHKDDDEDEVSALVHKNHPSPFLLTRVRSLFTCRVVCPLFFRLPPEATPTTCR